MPMAPCSDKMRDAFRTPGSSCKRLSNSWKLNCKTSPYRSQGWKSGWQPSPQSSAPLLCRYYLLSKPFHETTGSLPCSGMLCLEHHPQRLDNSLPACNFLNCQTRLYLPARQTCAACSKAHLATIHTPRGFTSNILCPPRHLVSSHHIPHVFITLTQPLVSCADTKCSSAPLQHNHSLPCAEVNFASGPLQHKH